MRNIISECERRIKLRKEYIKDITQLLKSKRIYGEDRVQDLINLAEAEIGELQDEIDFEMNILIEKWTPVLQSKNGCTTSMIIESQETPYIDEIPECIKRIELKYKNFV